MQLSLAELQDQSVSIAWDYLSKSGDLGEPQEAARFLSIKVESMIRKGSRSRLLLSNKAIIAYRDFKMPVKCGPTIIYSV